MRISFSFTVILCISIWPVMSPAAYSSPQTLLGDFQRGWEKDWEERVLAEEANRYQVVEEGGNRVLKFESRNSASGLWRKWEIEPVQSGRITWRWRVQSSLVQNRSEKEKEGDDYAARVFVVFEPHFLSWRTRAVCYVWAGREPVGGVYGSPFASSVATVVVESGNEKAGQSIREQRDFVADYKEYFGVDPTEVSAFAVMVDTDNTEAEVTAWFDDMVVEINP